MHTSAEFPARRLRSYAQCDLTLHVPPVSCKGKYFGAYDWGVPSARSLERLRFGHPVSQESCETADMARELLSRLPQTRERRAVIAAVNNKTKRESGSRQATPARPYFFVMPITA